MAQSSGKIMEVQKKQVSSGTQPYLFAEIIETQQDTEHRVVVNLSSDFRTMITDKMELKKTSALNKQEFSSVLDALTFLSVNGWDYVDQVMQSSERSMERRILVRKPRRTTVSK